MEQILLNLFVYLDWAGKLDQLQFSSPEWLWLMWLWPVLWGLAAFSAARSGQGNKDDLAEQRNEQRVLVRHSLIHLFAQGDNKIEQSFVWHDLWFNLMRGMLIILLAIILAHPVEKQPPPSQPQAKTVRDIAFVIESSASFLLPDYVVDGQPQTRMNAVKQVLDKFIAGLPGNRFGITIYADQAFNLLSMTADQTLARLMLKRLQPYLAGRTDIAMGEALGLALQQADSKLQKAVDENRSARKRVVVLISDGLSRPSRLELTEAVNYAQLLGVPIYSIGVGSRSAAADQRKFSGLLYQPLESESLQRIAGQTGGQYYQVGSGAEIEEVLEQINQLEGSVYLPPPQAANLKPLYRPLLEMALMLLLLYWLSRIWWRLPSSNKGEH